MKVAVIGAGSFVFGPSVLAETFLELGLNDVEIALIDPDFDVVTLMAGVGRRMASERGLRTTITAHADRSAAALDGAEFVICSASREMKKRTAMDWEIIDELAPGHLKTEFGGIAGISYSLRQIALIEEITDDMKRQCPNAWLLDAANPLPRVTQAAQENGIQTAGFCAVALSAYAMLWQIFNSEHLDFPYTKVRAVWEVTSAGLNHLSWVTRFRDRATGEDLLPHLRELLAAGVTSGNPLDEQQGRETGYLLVPGDDHSRDFLTPAGPSVGGEGVPWHGGPEERRRRIELLRAVGEGHTPWDTILGGLAWEKPMAFAAALSGGTPAQFSTMNLLNAAGQISNLPPNVFAETPCSVSAAGVVPETITLPETVLPLCLRTALVTDTIVRAARERSRALVHEAVRLDPTVLDKEAGLLAIDRCLAVHADLLPEYR